MSKRALGTLLVSVSACAFGSYAYFALLATRAGIGTASLLFYRFGIAALILGGVAAATRSRFPDFRGMLALVGLGLLYVGQSFTYLQCLKASSPITASLLLYLYPAFVAVGSVLFLKERMTPAKGIALVCALGGSILIVGPARQVGGIAVVYGLGTALFYAAYMLCGRKVMQGVSAIPATLTILASTTVVYGVASLFLGFDIPSSPQGWIGAVGLALVATVVAIGALLAGLERVGAVEASSLSALEPLTTALVAVAFLGEPLRLWHVAGGVLVIVAVLVLARQSEVPQPDARR
ncbi:MAG TPA: DMT family transporter [Fimbriimonadaceae bacterium]|nr:DMT family transporter [Fimbriimonadaceae bacterium]